MAKKSALPESESEKRQALGIAYWQGPAFYTIAAEHRVLRFDSTGRYVPVDEADTLALAAYQSRFGSTPDYVNVKPVFEMQV